MTSRQYIIPMTGVVTVNAESGTVEIEVDLTDAAFDLRYDYDHEYPNGQTQDDQQVITDCLMQSPSNFSMKHTMESK